MPVELFARMRGGKIIPITLDAKQRGTDFSDGAVITSSRTPIGIVLDDITLHVQPRASQAPVPAYVKVPMLAVDQ
jgi:hypothetical protein